MKRWGGGLLCAGLLAGPAAAMCTPEPADEAALGYFVGRYDLLGRHPDDGQPFSAVAEFSLDQTLRVRWSGPRGEVLGEAQLERCGGDGIAVLRIALRERERDFEAQCRYQSEFDNYARITCRVLAKQAKDPEAAPGLLALFYRHADED